MGGDRGSISSEFGCYQEPVIHVPFTFPYTIRYLAKVYSVRVIGISMVLKLLNNFEKMPVCRSVC